MKSFNPSPAATNHCVDILDSIMDQWTPPHIQYQPFALPQSSLDSFQRSVDVEMADPHMPFTTSFVRGVTTPSPAQLEADRLSAIQQREISIRHDNAVKERKAYETNYSYLYPIAGHLGQYVLLPDQDKITSTSRGTAVPIERINEMYPNAHRVYDTRWKPVRRLLEYIKNFDDALEPVRVNARKGKGLSEMQPTECPPFYDWVMKNWREGPIKGSKEFLAFTIAALAVVKQKDHPAYRLFWDTCLIRDGSMRVYERTVNIIKEIQTEYPSRIHSLKAEKDEFKALYCTLSGKRKFVPDSDPDDVRIPRPMKRLRSSQTTPFRQQIASSKSSSESKSKSSVAATKRVTPKFPPAPKITKPRAPRAKSSLPIAPPEGLRRSGRITTQTEKVLLTEKGPVEMVPTVTPPVAPVVQSAAKEILSAKTKSKSKPKRKARTGKKAKQEIIEEAIVAEQPVPAPKLHTPAKGSPLRAMNLPVYHRSGSSSSETVTSPVNEGRHLSTESSGSNVTLVTPPSPPKSAKRKREGAEEEVVSPVVAEVPASARVTRGRGRVPKTPATPAVVPAATQPCKRRKTKA